jgi:ATP-dependent DNA ligase
VISLGAASLPVAHAQVCRTSQPRVALPPRRAGRLHEAKFGGWRIQLHKDGSFVSLFTKSGYDCTQRFGELCSALAAVPARSCIIDREVTAFDPLGLLDFHALRFRTADDEDIAVPYAGPRGGRRHFSV